MNRQIKITGITGKKGEEKVFLDGVQVFPTSIKITITTGHGSAIMTFEEIQVETDLGVTSVREVTEKVK